MDSVFNKVSIYLSIYLNNDSNVDNNDVNNDDNDGDNTMVMTMLTTAIMVITTMLRWSVYITILMIITSFVYYFYTQVTP